VIASPGNPAMQVLSYLALLPRSSSPSRWAGGRCATRNGKARAAGNGVAISGMTSAALTWRDDGADELVRESAGVDSCGCLAAGLWPARPKARGSNGMVLP